MIIADITNPRDKRNINFDFTAYAELSNFREVPEELSNKTLKWDGEKFIEDTEAELLTQQKAALKQAFVNTWEAFPRFLKLTYDKIKAYVLDCIEKWDIPALVALSQDPTIPQELNSFKEQLAALLPIEGE